MEDVVGATLSREAARLVAARSRGHADAAAPVQQRHGLRGRPATAVGRVGGRGRRGLVLHRLREGPGVHRRRSGRSRGGDHGLRQRARPHEPGGPRQDVRSQGPDDPGHHLHAVRLARARGRRQEAVHGRRRTDRRAGGPRGSVHVRQGSRRHGARERHHLLLFPRGGLLPRRRPRHPELPHQRHQHRGDLRHRILGRPARAEHHPPQQHRGGSPVTTPQRSRSSTRRGG